MKKIIFTLALFLTAINIMAQEHLKFKGIPIEGSITSFCQKLKAEGYTSMGVKENIHLFSGKFTGRDAVVAAFATTDGKNIYSVSVGFMPDDQWNNLTSTYYYYKDLYTRKYGNPAFSKELNPATFDSNTSLMYELSQGTVVYASEWDMTGGDIQLSIENSTDIGKGLIIIRYRDAQNVEAKIQNDLDDI